MRFKPYTLTDKELSVIIDTFRNGYENHRPNKEVANILLLQANCGLKLDEILNFDTNNIILENGVYRYCVNEKKYILTKQAMDIIKTLGTGRLFTMKSQALWKHIRIVTEYLFLENISSESFRKYFAQKIYEKSGNKDTVRAFLQQDNLRYVLD